MEYFNNDPIGNYWLILGAVEYLCSYRAHYIHLTLKYSFGKRCKITVDEHKEDQDLLKKK